MTDTTTLRTATSDDIDAVDTLIQRSYMTLLKDDYPPSVLVTAVPVMAHAEPELVEAGRFFLAESDGRITTAGGWSEEPPGGMAAVPHVAHVRHIATDPAMVHLGGGRAVMTRLMDEARAAGMLQLQGLAAQSAVGFYEKFGFSPEAETLVELAGGIRFPAVLMGADL